MKKYNAENERIKHRYLADLREADGKSEASLDVVAKALSRFEEYTGHRDFRTFRHEQAIAFKRHLTAQVSRATGKPLSKATLNSTLNALQSFFRWLAVQPGYRSRLTSSDARYFRLSAKDVRIATAHRERSGPTLEQIKHVIRTMPASSEIERRDRAVIAFAILTGARDGAIASFRLKHLDFVEDKVEQIPPEVNTKGGKTITTWFFPVGDEIRQIVVDWVEFLRTEKLWGLDDPLFPATKVEQDADHRFAAAGIARTQWSNAGTIRKIFRAAFEQAGLPYFNPHSFRKTLMQLAFKLDPTAEQFKAWSQNLGHQGVLTTFTSYGAVAPHRQAEIMRALNAPQNPAVSKDMVEQIADAVSRRIGAQAGDRPPGDGIRL